MHSSAKTRHTASISATPRKLAASCLGRARSALTHLLSVSVPRTEHPKLHPTKPGRASPFSPSVHGGEPGVCDGDAHQLGRPRGAQTEPRLVGRRLHHRPLRDDAILHQPPERNQELPGQRHNPDPAHPPAPTAKAAPLAMLFLADADLVPLAATVLRWFAVAQFFSSLSICTQGASGSAAPRVANSVARSFASRFCRSHESSGSRLPGPLATEPPRRRAAHGADESPPSARPARPDSAYAIADARQRRGRRRHEALRRERVAVAGRRRCERWRAQLPTCTRGADTTGPRHSPADTAANSTPAVASKTACRHAATLICATLASVSARLRSTSVTTKQGRASAAHLTGAIGAASRMSP